MKKFLFILIIIFICGLLSADICLKQMQGSEVFVDLDVYERYATSKIYFKEVFLNLLYERIKIFIVIILLCFTVLKEKVGMLIAPLFSFMWGFFMMASLVELGVAGLIIGLAVVLPHGVLYGAVISLWIGKTKRYHAKNKIVAEVGRYLFMLLLFFTACVIESLVGTHFIPWVIRLSLV